MRFPRRDAGCARALGGGAPKSANLWFRFRDGTAGASRRASGDVCAAPGRAFRFGRCARSRPRGHSARPNVSQLLEGSHRGTARNPGQHGGGSSCLSPDFLSRKEPAAAACVSLPRHETALFGSERCVWRELEGIGAPGADDRSDRSPECVEFMRVPVAAPLRVGATSNCPFASSGDRHRYGLAGRSAQQTSTLRIASEPGMALRTRAAIKPSLTLTRLVLPRCTEAP